MLVYFIGGPWNNWLVDVPERTIRITPYWRVPAPPRTPASWVALAKEFLSHATAETQYVTYARDISLPTGVPVFSCLRFDGEPPVSSLRLPRVEIKGKTAVGNKRRTR